MIDGLAFSSDTGRMVIYLIVFKIHRLSDYGSSRHRIIMSRYRLVISKTKTFHNRKTKKMSQIAK